MQVFVSECVIGYCWTHHVICSINQSQPVRFILLTMIMFIHVIHSWGWFFAKVQHIRPPGWTFSLINFSSWIENFEFFIEMKMICKYRNIFRSKLSGAESCHFMTIFLHHWEYDWSDCNRFEKGWSNVIGILGPFFKTVELLERLCLENISGCKCPNLI